MTLGGAKRPHGVWKGAQRGVVGQSGSGVFSLAATSPPSGSCSSGNIHSGRESGLKGRRPSPIHQYWWQEGLGGREAGGLQASGWPPLAEGYVRDCTRPQGDGAQALLTSTPFPPSLSDTLGSRTETISASPPGIEPRASAEGTGWGWVQGPAFMNLRVL